MQIIQNAKRESILLGGKRQDDDWMTRDDPIFPLTSNDAYFSKPKWKSYSTIFILLKFKVRQATFVKKGKRNLEEQIVRTVNTQSKQTNPRWPWLTSIYSRKMAGTNSARTVHEHCWSSLKASVTPIENRNQTKHKLIKSNKGTAIISFSKRVTKQNDEVNDPNTHDFHCGCICTSQCDIYLFTGTIISKSETRRPSINDAPL